MTITQEHVVRAFAEQDHTHRTVEEIRRAARHATPDAVEAELVARALVRSATMQPDVQKQYVEEIIDSLRTKPRLAAMVGKNAGAAKEPDHDAIIRAYRLLDDTADILESLPQNNPRCGAIREDVGAVRRRAARAIAGAMMFQTMLSAEEKAEYVTTLAESMPRRNATLRTIGKLTATVLRMNTWPMRRMTDHNVLEARQSCERRLRETSVLNRPGMRPQTDREVENSILDRIIAARAERLIVEHRAVDTEHERDMIRFWMEVGDNRPGLPASECYA